jgi:hypothetical protein
VSTALLRCSLGDLAILSGYHRLSVRGNWMASVECASTSIPSGPCSIVITPELRADEPPRQPDVFNGFVRFADTFAGADALTVEVVGGAGQLLTVLGPVDHITGVTQVPAGVVLRSIVAALPGEQLAAGVEQAMDAYLLPRWHRAGGTTGRDAIDLLVYDLATSTGLEFGWRVLADGTIWVGVETWPALDVATVGTEYAGQVTTDATIVYAPSGAPLLPGTTVTSSGKGGALSTRAVEVLYTLIPPALRARVRATMPGDPPFAPRLDLYRASWPASLAAPQNADGTIDVTCDDARMGDLRSVPVRLGIPGAAVVGLPLGARVRVAFDGASPRGAFAYLADQDPAATHALALVGDGCGYLSANAAGGPVVFLLSPVATGNPGEVAITVRGPGHKFARGVSA